MFGSQKYDRQSNYERKDQCDRNVLNPNDCPVPSAPLIAGHEFVTEHHPSFRLKSYHRFTKTTIYRSLSDRVCEQFGPVITRNSTGDLLNHIHWWRFVLPE